KLCRLRHPSSRCVVGKTSTMRCRSADNKPGNEKHDAVRRQLDVCAEGKSRERSCRDHHSPHQPDQDADRTLAEVGPTHTGQIAHTHALDDLCYFLNTLVKNAHIS